MTENLLQWWPVILTFIGVVIWFIRLEARVNRNTTELQKIEERFVEQRKEDMVVRKEHFDSIEGRLVVIQEDIKELIKNVSK
jgi:hypothetical protein